MSTGLSLGPIFKIKSLYPLNPGSFIEDINGIPLAQYSLDFNGDFDSTPNLGSPNDPIAISDSSKIIFKSSPDLAPTNLTYSSNPYSVILLFNLF